MNTIPKHVFTLLCDDIRNEEGNKVSFIGVYGNKVIVETLPFTMSKLCVVMRVSGGSGKHNLTCSLKNPSDKELLQSTQMIEPPQPNAIGTLGLQITPFVIEEEGIYKFIALIDEKKFHSMEFEIRVKGKETQ